MLQPNTLSIRSLACAALICTGLLVPVTAWSSPLEVYGASGRGSAMGNAMTAEAAGVESIFYNPATLTRAEPSVAFGLTLGFDNADILLQDRPNGYDVPDLGSITPTIPSEDTLNERADTDNLGTFYLLNIGGVTSLGSENLRAAALVTLPVGGVGDSQTHFADERERLFSNQLHYELIDGRARRFNVEFGLGYRLIPNLSLGLGMVIQPGVDLSNAVYLENATDQEIVDINLRQSQGFNYGVNAGILYEIQGIARIGLSYRQALQFTIDGDNEIQIRGLDAEDDVITQELSWRPASSPTLLNLGAAADVGRTTLSADLRYARWSEYEDTQGASTDFEDTLSPHIGIEYAYSDSTDVRAGAFFEPTPVPEQSGRTNYVDNARLGGSLGAAHRFSLVGREVEVNWFLQMQFLLPQTVEKEELAAYPECGDGVTQLCDEVRDGLRDSRTGEIIPEAAGLQTTNPGFPGYSSGGWIGALGVDLRWYL